MKQLFFTCIKYWLLIFCLQQASLLQAQRKMEKLDRGLVAVQTGNGIFLSWRMFGVDPETVAFNIYRNGTKINASPITGATNMIDAEGSSDATYTVRPIIGGIEQAEDGIATVWDSQVKTINLSNRPSNNHVPNDINVGDLDGDGQYELVVKWYPNNAKDNSQSGVTDNTYLAAYKLDGTFLWIIDLGRNIRSGAHYTQHLVGDYDADGYAEVACKTAPGTRDGSGQYLNMGPAASDNDAADYRNSGGYILSGPEYITIFNGQTGEEMATTDYVVARGNVGSWGDTYGNRVDRFNATNACLDGVKTSMVFQRGYYTRMTMAAFDWDGQTLAHRWTFDSNNSGNGDAYGQGNHSIMAADIDNDGLDELLPGSCAIDHDGSLIWTTGYGHGDANHVGDFDPNSPGLEIWQVSENKGSEPDHQMIRASTGQILWSSGSGNDNGRGMIADIDDRYPGQEAWSNSVSGTYTADGNQFTGSKPGSTNFRIYWDGDLQDELPNGSSNNTNNRIDKWNGNGTTSILNLTGLTCNGTKATPNLSADILGDWREEIILHDGGTRLYLHTTTIPTQHKLYTLMHDPVYRNAISWQQSSYNQPPHLGFFLGAGVENAPTPNITLVGGTDCNGVEGGNAYTDQCNECVGGNTGKEACFIDCNGDIDGTATIDQCGNCSGGNTGITACAGALQGENFCEAVGVQEAINTGFVGEGYLNFDNQTGASATWTIIAESAGTYTINITYANGGNTSRQTNVIINGTNQTIFNAEVTESWTNWQTETVSLSLTAGVNTLQLIANTADGGPNVDQFTWTDNALSAGGCTTDCNGVFGGIAYEDECNQCVGGNTGKEACQQDCNGDWGGTAFQDNCGICAEGNTGQSACTGSMEAETACDVDGILLESVNPGFSGEGYVNTTNILGSYATWIINSATPQTVTLAFVYANGGTTSRDGTISVNGVTSGNLILPTTGSWENWQIASVELELLQGNNEITATANTTEGLANLDLIVFYSEGISDAECELITSLTNHKNKQLTIYPVPTKGMVYLNTQESINWELYNDLGQKISSGQSNQINLTNQPEGVYIVRTQGQVFKIIKQ